MLKSFGEASPDLFNQLQHSFSRSSRATGDYDISDGEIVEITVPAGGSNSVQSPLGRQPIGAIVVSQSDGTARSVVTSVSSSNEIYVGHNGSDEVTYSVWVF